MSGSIRAFSSANAFSCRKSARVVGQAPQVDYPCPLNARYYYARFGTGCDSASFTSFTAAHQKAKRCQALPSSSGDVADVVSSGQYDDKGSPAPYKWSWQEDDVEPSTIVELDTAAVGGASSIEDLTAVLQAAAADAPPRAVLCAASRSALYAAVVKLLAGDALAAKAPCTIADAARLFAAYAALLQGASSGMTAAPAGPAAAGVLAGPAVARPLAASSEPSTPSPVMPVLAYVCASGAGGERPRVSSASARDLSDLLWAVAELQEDLRWTGWQPASRAGNAVQQSDASASGEGSTACSGGGADPHESVPAALQRAVQERLENQDFLAPDLCRTVCALGTLSMATASAAEPASGLGRLSEAGGESSSGRTGAAQASAGFRLDTGLVKMLNEEIRYQLTEFAADFEAADLGRLITGMWALRLGSAVAGDEEYRRVLMKAVYGKTRSLVDKAAVDFALSRLLDDDPEARSMHYDSRWTHEELRWLPRRERDKRRIIKEGWYRTQWGGWAPGGK